VTKPHSIDRRTVLRYALAGAGLVVASPALAATAGDAASLQNGAGPVLAEIMVLHATQAAGAGSIDPQIAHVQQLKKPPFSAYNTYKLLDRKTLPLDRGKAASQELANKGVLQVTLREVSADKRYKVAAELGQPGGAPFGKVEVTAAPNETFFVAGPSYDRGILVIAITLKG
jgi:hypothetical protein